MIGKNISQLYYDYMYNGKVSDDEDLAYEYNELGGVDKLDDLLAYMDGEEEN